MKTALPKSSFLFLWFGFFHLLHQQFSFLGQGECQGMKVKFLWEFSGKLCKYPPQVIFSADPVHLGKLARLDARVQSPKHHGVVSALVKRWLDFQRLAMTSFLYVKKIFWWLSILVSGQGFYRRTL